MTAPVSFHQSGSGLCPDCGEQLDRHCTVWPQDGDVFLQCPYPRRCVSLTRGGDQCKRDAVLFHHRIGWCSQHAPSYLREARV